jgi:hypothetical protein
VGTQHLIEEADLEAFEEPEMAPLPAGWRRTSWGEPMPNVVRWLHEDRRSH